MAKLTTVGALDLDGSDGVEVRVLLVRARAGSIDAVLQVPLVLGEAPDDEPTLVGRLDGRAVLDGAAHPAFVGSWLSVADGPGTAADPGTARPVSGEQSNTSVVLGGPAPTAILKVLRALHAGENPDVDVPRHLVDQGWTHVPAPLAWLQASWADPTGRLSTGYLGVLSAFVPDAQDGFELACAHARGGDSFASLAGPLGGVVATMHAALVAAYGPDPAPGGPSDVARSVAGRFSWAVSAVPSLARYAPGVEQVVAAVGALDSVPLRQRVHGDLHLGQVLRSSDRWFVTDFEGEPLAPLDQRVRPDLALRDVAGMLRSFDYAAAVGGLAGDAASAWTTAARDAFVAAYGAVAGADADAGAQRVLLRALELDKTLYEAVYESRNRPTWLPIPLSGLDRLVA